MPRPGHSRLITKSVCVAAAGSSPIWRADAACKVVAVRGYRVGGTGAVVNAQKNTTDLCSADKSLTSAATWMAGTLTTTAADLKLAAGDTLFLEVVSVAGTPTSVTVQVDLRYDADAA